MRRTGTALLAEMQGMRTEMAGVRESIEGLRAEFRVLAVSVAPSSRCYATRRQRGVCCRPDGWDEAGDGVAGTRTELGRKGTAGDEGAANETEVKSRGG